MLFEKAGRNLEVLKDKRNYSSELTKLESKFPDDPVQGDPVLEFLREKEIRDRLTGMTERQILSHFGDSLFDGSYPVLVNAILNAPAGFELLSEKDLEKLKAVSKKNKSPENADKIELFRKLHASISQMFSLFRKELDTYRKKELPENVITNNFQIEIE
jgi:hypothetical protein